MSRLPEPPPDWRKNPALPPLIMLGGLTFAFFLMLFRSVVARYNITYNSLASCTIVLGVIMIAAILIVAKLRALSLMRGERKVRMEAEFPAVRNAPQPVTAARFDDLTPGRDRQMILTLDHLRRALLVTGQPGSGKTTLLRSIGRAGVQAGRRDPAQPVLHTVVIDAHRTLATFMAHTSERLGRDTIVIDVGADDHITPIAFPRPGPSGAAGAADTIRRAWFSFLPEVPTQTKDALLHIFTLLAAGGYGLEQALRLLISPGFRDEVIRRAGDQLPSHAGTWVALIDNMTRSEWSRKFWPSIARLFVLLEDDAVRLSLAGRHSTSSQPIALHGTGMEQGFSFETLNDPDYAGPGIDVIVTAGGTTSVESIYFLFGLLFGELANVLHKRLDLPPSGRWPEIVVIADEIGRYGGPEALLEHMATARNEGVRLVIAGHSLATLDRNLQERLPVLAVNRIAGSETGLGAELTAKQLHNFDPNLVATRDSLGNPTKYWSPEQQLREFEDWLKRAKDFDFAIRLDDSPDTVRGRLVRDADLFHEQFVLEQALERMRARGQPVATIRARLDRENAELDARFGPVHYEPPAGAEYSSSDAWRLRPDKDFEPSFFN